MNKKSSLYRACLWCFLGAVVLFGALLLCQHFDLVEPELASNGASCLIVFVVALIAVAGSAHTFTNFGTKLPRILVDGRTVLVCPVPEFQVMFDAMNPEYAIGTGETWRRLLGVTTPRA
jgi:hypothetical protein